MTAKQAAKAADTTTAPEGYMKDAQGRLVPTSMVKEIDIMRDALVQELVTEAREVANAITTFKSKVFDLVGKFAQRSAAQYDAPVGGKKGNITLHTYDGRYKLLVATADNITFDERLQSAKALVDACIEEWSQGSRDEIKVLVQQAFQTDKEGNLNTGRVLGLRGLDIKDERWQSAMKAIGDSVQVVGSKRYVRFYERVGDTDKYVAISLDIAGA